MITIFSSLEEVIDYLADTCTYVKLSPKKLLFLSTSPKRTWSKELKESILSFFKGRTEEDLKQINLTIKNKHNLLHPFTPINHWIESSRPREIMASIGPENMSDVQLLTILISHGKVGTSAETMAQNLLNHYETLRGLSQASMKELCKISGIGLAKASRLKSGLELGKRLGKERIDKKAKLKRPEQVLNFVTNQIGLELQDSKKEYLYVILLDNKMKPLRTFFSTFGSIDTNVVDIQDIIRRISEYGATSIILVHNHPSGETQPSQEDEETTRRVSKACNLVGVKLVDHVIVGSDPEDYFSFQKKGLL
jgi:DNA repair protein RadC